MADTAPTLDHPPAPAAGARLRPAVPRPRPLPALGAGALVAVAVALLRTTGVLGGYPALVVAFLLVLAVPSSRLGSRRLLLAAGWAAGLLPALWWWDLPLGRLGRVGLLLAALAGGLTASVLWRGPRAARERAALLLPTWRAVDLAVAAAAAFGAVACRGLLAVRDGAQALAAVQPAWDNSAHVDMVLMLRRAGAVIPSLSAPAGGGTWKFADYPEGHHAVVATVMELLGTATPGSAADEMVLYARAQGFVLAAAAVVLVAGLCALPTAPRRPAATVLAAAGVSAVYLVGPGASAYTSGFPNFVLGCAMAGAVLLLAVTVPRPLTPVPLAAIGGLLVGVAHSWVLLLALALPAAALVALPPRRAAWRAPRRDVVLSALVVVLTAGGGLVALLTLRRLAAADVLVIPGGIAVPGAGLMLAVCLAAVAAALLTGAGRTRRTPWTAVVPAAGLATAGAVGVLQLRSTGELSYYFWKLFLGVALVAVVALAVALLGRSPRRGGPRVPRWQSVAAVTVGCLALTQLHGLTGRSTGELRVTPDQVARADALLRAAETAAATGRPDVVYVRADDAIHPVNAQQWLLALTGTWTSATEAGATELLAAATPADVAAIALARGATVVVAPQDVAALGLEDAPADQVVTWG